MHTERFVVMTERDVFDWRDSAGPIVHEHCGRMSFDDAARQLAVLEPRYGRAQIYKLVPVNNQTGEVE